MNIEYLIEKYNRLVYKICFNMLSDSLDAEDITQEAYLSFYMTKDRYKDLDENEIKNLICKIALNKCRDVLKSKLNKMHQMTDNNIEDLENYEDDNEIEEEIFKEDQKKQIQEAINNLKYPYNEVIKCYYMDELSLDEISKKLEIPKPTLKMQIYRAKSILKETLNISEGGDLLWMEKK